MAKAATSKKKTDHTLTEAVMVYTKTSSHFCALVQPQFVSIEGQSFISGKQSTGKEGFRMEGKNTLIPFDLVTMIVEFASEDDLWSEPQPKHLPLPDAHEQSVPLTSHEQQGQPRPQHSSQHGAPHEGHHSHGRRHRRHHRKGHFQGQSDFNRDRFGNS